MLAPQHFSETHKINPVVETTGLPALLSDQVFGNVYPEALLRLGRTPGPVPDHLDRRVLYHLLSRRLAADPDFIGVSFCACLHDNSHTVAAYDRGQPGFFTIDNEPRSRTIDTVIKENDYIYQQVRRPMNETAIKRLDDEYHETNAHYRAIFRPANALLAANESLRWLMQACGWCCDQPAWVQLKKTMVNFVWFHYTQGKPLSCGGDLNFRT